MFEVPDRNLKQSWMPFAFVTRIVYTIGTTIFPALYANDADDLGSGTPPESQPVSPRDGDEESAFRGDETWRTGRPDDSGKEEEDAEATGRGFTAGYSGGASSDSERGMVHNRRSSTARGPAPIILQWSPKADEELMRLPREIMSRVTAKMEWFAQQDNPLVFAKRLHGLYAGSWRFRIGDHWVVCDIDSGRRLLIVLSGKNRRDAY